MTKNDSESSQQKFYITNPSPCPYIAGQLERKVFTNLEGPDAAAEHEKLNHVGFRRSQNIVYRPACESCQACIPVRVKTLNFSIKKSLRRTYNRFRNITVAVEEASATYEQYDLLRRYLASRHATGGMADMNEFDYADMVELSPVTTRIVEYRTPPPSRSKHQNGNLVGATLIDVLSDGLSLVYSFYRPERPYSGFGTFMILDHIVRVQNAGLPYLYLGYWVENCKSMAYKTRFQPLEWLSKEGWLQFRPNAH